MKLSYSVLVMLFFISMVNACSDNNAFISGSPIDICTGSCVYENESSLGTFVNCDSTVSCYLYLYYSNSSAIVFNQLMTLNSSIFNYTLNSTLPVGTYDGFVSCDRTVGFSEEEFSISVSAATTGGGATGIGGSGSGIIGDNNIAITENPNVPVLPKPSFLQPFIDIFNNTAKKIYPKSIVIGRFIILILVLILIFWRQIMSYFKVSKTKSQEE